MRAFVILAGKIVTVHTWTRTRMLVVGKEMEFCGQISYILVLELVSILTSSRPGVIDLFLLS